jgi:hypothetical protein
MLITGQALVWVDDEEHELKEGESFFCPRAFRRPAPLSRPRTWCRASWCRASAGAAVPMPVLVRERALSDQDGSGDRVVWVGSGRGG